jgi:hypothetical protein
VALEEAFAERDMAALRRIYAEAYAQIQAYIQRPKATTFQKVRGEEIARQIRATLSDLEGAQRAWLNGRLPASYRVGMRAMAGALGRPLPTLSGVHRTAVGAIAEEITRETVGKALPSVAANVSQAFIRAKQTIVAHERLMERLGVATVRGFTVEELTRSIVTTLRDGATARLGEAVDDATKEALRATAEGRWISIRGRDGVTRRYGLRAYSRLVARTATRMAHSEGVLQTARQFGVDLVQVSVHAGSCPRCLPFQGKVFSVSGANVDFPALTDENRPPIHPNCAHVLLPAPEEVLRQRGLYEGLAEWSRHGKPVESLPAYHDLLRGLRQPVGPPPRRPRPTRPPRPRPAPPSRQAPLREAILGAGLVLQDVWKGVSAEAGDVAHNVTGLRHDPSTQYAGYYDIYTGGIALSSSRWAAVEAWTNEAALRPIVQKEMAITRFREAFQKAFRHGVEEASLTELQAGAVAFSPDMRAAWNTLTHEVLHGTYARRFQGWRGYGFHLYGYKNAAGAWQEALTEFWARRTAARAAEALTPGLREALGRLRTAGFTDFPLEFSRAASGAYQKQVGMLVDVLRSTGRPAAALDDFVARLKFHTAVGDRAASLAAFVAEAWDVSDPGVIGEIEQVFTRGLGTKGLGSIRAGSVFRRLREVLQRAAERGLAKEPSVMTDWP